MTGMADENHRIPARCVVPRLGVHLRHERAGCVDRRQLSSPGSLADGRGHSVSREDDPCPDRHLILVVDEDRASAFELAHDVNVVNNLLTNVNRGTPELQRLLDGADRALDACAVAARSDQNKPFDHPGASLTFAVETHATRRRVSELQGWFPG